ncbi:MAG: hypothetical protein M3M98_01425, partial [Nitrospirota bacterium]|nr:hypothetical protein [Nitrospirota bacterium]
VGVNSNIITNGTNGFLASTEQDWYDSLEALCLQPQLRRQMGQSGRRMVEERYSLTVWGPRLVELYRTFAQSGQDKLTQPDLRSSFTGHGHWTGTR